MYYTSESSRFLSTCNDHSRPPCTGLYSLLPNTQQVQSTIKTLTQWSMEYIYRTTLNVRVRAHKGEDGKDHQIFTRQ